MKLVIATRNRHKLDELRHLLAAPGLDLCSALDFLDVPEVAEDGDTFEANAVKKAEALCHATGLWALGDDSGLEVDALGGAPGVRSARYSGEPTDYARNNTKLLRELAGRADRSARFRCVIALARPGEPTLTVEGRCEGRIASAPRGAGGFGYDPLFVPDGRDRTFAELPAEEKHAVSHRGRALRRAREEWGALLGLAAAAEPGAELLDRMRGYMLPCLLAAGADLDVFSSCLDDARTAGELAAERGADARALAVLLDALAAAGLLDKTGDRYRVPDRLRAALDAENPRTVLPALHHQANCLRRWARLPWVVTHGPAAQHHAPSLRGEDADRAAFIGAMNVASGPSADALITAVKPAAARCVLDVGGASGTWTLAWLRALPEARAILFDLPPVIPLARERIGASGFAGRVTLAAGNYHHDPLPRGADLAWVSAIVHQNTREQNRALFRRVAEALEPGGRLMIRDIVMEECRTRPAAGAWFAVNMLVATEGGGTFTLGELRADLEAAGFGDVRRLHHDPGMNSVVEARLPAR